jgi:hypothetical protein
MADRIRQALDAPVALTKPIEKAQVREIVRLLASQLGDNRVPFFVQPPEQQVGPVSITLEGTIPFGAALQVLEDAAGVRVFIRDYGLLITLDDAAPRGAMTLSEFLQSQSKEKK